MLGYIARLSGTLAKLAGKLRGCTALLLMCRRCNLPALGGMCKWRVLSCALAGFDEYLLAGGCDMQQPKSEPSADNDLREIKDAAGH
jgi:hypothetical protein